MRPGPVPPDSPVWQRSGRVVVGTTDKGAGVAVGSRLVLTASHVVAGGQPGGPISFKTFDGRLVDVIAPVRFAEGLDAAALDLADDVAWSQVANAKAGDRWSAAPTGASNDPILTGTVTAIGLPLSDAKGNRVTALQLEVEQNLGGFKGYSGSAVLNEQGQVTGLLIEQKLQRLNASRSPASNVLFALPIAEVAKSLHVDVDLAEPVSGIYLRESFAPLIQSHMRFFAGRADVMAKIDQFVRGSAAGYLVITAPAGFGKTALVANLVTREPSRFVYHFFSQIYGSDGLDEWFFLKNVVQQFLWLAGQNEPIPESIEQLRAIYQHVLSQSAPGRRVLVLDGLHEISSWNVGPYLSRRLPANTRVILTVRDTGQDWADAYGIPADQTVWLHLDGLNRDELADALRLVGEQGAVLADDGSLLDRIVAMAAYAADPDLGADPFFVRFLLDDVATGRLTAQSIIEQPRGLSAYLDRWWNELRELAGDDPARDFFGTLTAALGPVGLADLAGINPSLRSAGGWDGDPLEAVLRRCRRMIFGNDAQGYALISPRLQAYARTKLDTKIYVGRILDYCAHWQDNNSGYALEHYAEHLLQAGSKQALYGLVSKAWIEARSSQSTYHAPAADTRLVIQVARSEEPPNLTQEVRHSLIYATLGSFTTNLRPGAFHLLARFEWEKVARAIASLLQDGQSRIAAEIAIGTGLLARGEGDMARAELRRAMLAAQPQQLSELAPAMARLGNFDEVAAALDRVVDQELLTTSARQCAIALGRDKQADQALTLADLFDAGLPRIALLGELTPVLAEAGEPEFALTAANTALNLADAIAEPEEKAHALALAAHALARAGATERAALAARASLKNLASASPDWRMMETVCVAAQALAPGGEIADVLRAAERIAQAVAAQPGAFVLARHDVYGECDLKSGNATFVIPDEEKDQQPESGDSDYARVQAVQQAALTGRSSLIAARLTFRNRVSAVPDNGLIVIAEVASAEEVRSNALSWIAQSLADEFSPQARAIADSLLQALYQADPRPNRIRAIAQSYISLLLAKAGDMSRADEIVRDTFALLESTGIDAAAYKYLMRALAPALQMIGDTQGARKAISQLSQVYKDESDFAPNKTALMQEVARQTLRQGDIAMSVGFGFLGIDDPAARAAFLTELIDALGQGIGAAEEKSANIAAIAGPGEALVNELPAHVYGQSVWTSAARVLADMGELDRAADLLGRVLDAGVAPPADTYEKTTSVIEIAEALANLGETARARTVMTQAVNTIRDTGSDLGKEDNEDAAKLSVKAARLLDRIGDLDTAADLLTPLRGRWGNTSQAVSDHAIALALAGRATPALLAADTIAMPAIKASTLTRIAIVLALVGSPVAEDVAQWALRLMAEGHGAPNDFNISAGMWVDPGDQESKEGSWLLSRAVAILPVAGGKLSDSLASAVAMAGAPEDTWMQSLGLDVLLKQILSGDTRGAVARLAELRANAETDADDFHATRTLRWVAELLIHTGETATALAVAMDISQWKIRGCSTDATKMDEWISDILRRLSEAFSGAGDRSAATDLAHGAMRAAERCADESVRSRARVRVIRTYAAIGEHSVALEYWHKDLPDACAGGRARLFDLLGAGAGALASEAQGRTLWNIYEAVTEVEGWWNSLHLG